jgi:hypothetical protein
MPPLAYSPIYTQRHSSVAAVGDATPLTHRRSASQLLIDEINPRTARTLPKGARSEPWAARIPTKHRSQCRSHLSR